MPFAMQRPKDPVTGERGPVAVDLDGLVYTIGVVGVNEMIQHHVSSQLHESREAFTMAVRAMTEMGSTQRLSHRHNMTIALARTPAETTGQRFSVSDLLNKNYRDHAKKVIKETSRPHWNGSGRPAIFRYTIQTGHTLRRGQIFRSRRGWTSSTYSSPLSTAETSSISGSVSRGRIRGA